MADGGGGRGPPPPPSTPKGPREAWGRTRDKSAWTRAKCAAMYLAAWSRAKSAYMPLNLRTLWRYVNVYYLLTYYTQKFDFTKVARSRKVLLKKRSARAACGLFMFPTMTDRTVEIEEAIATYIRFQLYCILRMHRHFAFAVPH